MRAGRSWHGPCVIGETSPDNPQTIPTHRTRFHRSPAMNTLIRKTVLTLSASLALVTLVAVSAAVAQSRLVLVDPDSGPDYCPPQLPEFGFAGFSVHGVGERVTFVRWGGLAAQLGLEPGDMILSMNGFPLNYHGSWTDALSEAVANGGWVQLRVRDVRTGIIAYRQTFVGGGEGPI